MFSIFHFINSTYYSITGSRTKCIYIIYDNKVQTILNHSLYGNIKFKQLR